MRNDDDGTGYQGVRRGVRYLGRGGGRGLMTKDKWQRVNVKKVAMQNM